mgnify:CR=1 FL=1
MDVFLYRHGITQGNAEKRYIGRTDEPLCEQGRLQLLDRRANAPLVNRVFLSPALRARQSAAILFPRAELSVVDDLREMDFGIFEGKTADEMTDDRDYRAWVEGQCAGRCPQGESTDEFGKRCLRGFQQIVSMHHANEPLVIVAHGGTIMAIMSKLGRPAREMWDWRVAPGSHIKSEFVGGYLINHTFA